MAKSKQKRYGVFYRSNGRWTGPYSGMTFTKHSLERNPIQSDVAWIRNYVLKSRIQIRPVTA
jgi:hypothetical protein